MVMLKAALGYVASTYLRDGVMRPRQSVSLARSYCDRVGKPLLLIHDGGLTQRLLRGTRGADMDTTRAYPLQAPTRSCGAIVAVSVLQQLKRPDVAMAEWRRVADKVFIVGPGWYNPQTWLLPWNRYLIDPSNKRATPVWTRRRGVVLLPVSDNGYGSPPWIPKPTTLPAVNQELETWPESQTEVSLSVPSQNSALDPSLRLLPSIPYPSTPYPSDVELESLQPPRSEPASDVSEGPMSFSEAKTESPVDVSAFLQPREGGDDEDYGGIGLSGSSSSVQTLMVVSEQTS